MSRYAKQDDGGGTTTTLRIDRPDGSVTEIRRDDDGRIITTRTGRDGALAARLVAQIGSDGVVTVTSEGEADSTTLEPLTVREQANPYGETSELIEYESGVSVENTFNDDGDLRSVLMRGAWGEQVLDLRPDGARTMHWNLGLHKGSQNWNAAGDLDHYELDCSDGTRFRWDLIDGVGRQVVVGWDGQERLTEDSLRPVSQGSGS